MKEHSDQEELLNYLFDGQPQLLAPPMTAWLSSSRRFTTFVATYRDKIRKKLYTAHDHESLLDLQLELETAYLMLQERPLSVRYEPQQSEQARAPDFAVTYTTSLTFLVEVTRLRADPQSSLVESEDSNSIASLGARRLTDAICSKLGQLQPQRSNVLIVGVEALRLTQHDLRDAMLRLQQRAERNDETLLQRHRFRDRADFFRHYQRLSEILVRRSRLQSDEPTVVWVNPQAKHPLPSKVRTALYHSQTIQVPS